MNFHLELFLCSTVLLVCSALGQTSIPVVVQRLIDKTQQMDSYLAKLIQCRSVCSSDNLVEKGYLDLTASSFPESRRNITEMLVQIKPYIASLPRSAGNFLNSSENVELIAKLSSLDKYINGEFGEIVRGLHYNLKKSSRYYTKIPEGDRIDALNFFLTHWNDMIVNVTIPFHKTLNLWSDSINSLPISKPGEYSSHFETPIWKYKYILKAARRDFVRSFDPILDGYYEALCDTQMSGQTRDKATRVLSSIRALADEMTRNCRDQSCPKFMRFDVAYIKTFTKCNVFNRFIVKGYTKALYLIGSYYFG